MPTVYRGEITAGPVTTIGPAPNPPDSVPRLQAGYALMACDDTWGYGLLVDLAVATYDGGANWQWTTDYIPVFRRGVNDNLDPWTWGTILNAPYPGAGSTVLLDAGAGDFGTAFHSGGVMAIEKDVDLQVVRWVTPLGTMTTPWAWLIDSPFNSSVLQSCGTTLQLLRPRDDTVACRIDVHWKNFFSYLNGVQFAGHALSLADPEPWLPWVEDDTPFPWLSFEDSTNKPPVSDTQLVSEIQTQIDYTPPMVIVPVQSGVDWYRYASMPEPGAGFSLDMCQAGEHGLLIGAWSFPPVRDMVRVRKSHDYGHTWTEYIAASSSTFTSVTVQYLGGIIYVCYEDLIGPKQTLSRDGGKTWSTPVPVSITGTNPRLVIGPDSTFFYFFLNTGNMYVVRSFDLGSTIFDASPLPVATTVPVQEFAALIASDGSLAAAYSDGSNNWITRRSRDFGLTWVTS